MRQEDKSFIAQVYAYIFIGLMLDWIKDDMREDPQQIVERLVHADQGLRIGCRSGPDSSSEEFLSFSRF